MGVGKKEYLGMELKKSQKRKTCKGRPGCHPGMARRAFAGFMEAGSIVVATSSVTISLSLSLSPLTVLRNLQTKKKMEAFYLTGRARQLAFWAAKMGPPRREYTMGVIVRHVVYCKRMNGLSHGF
ncbi:hypothetical protein TorRG33x02_273270 [Trema orientale]|uniref:Uncharacterized protein n=1 Tax=Trema orientale TaxID=63057 RepID=A0A2P5CTU3_TREOI|nr:hypothetical protein TorRG33x02_273270 [Trema orientale]